MDRLEAKSKLVIGLQIYRTCSAEQSVDVLENVMFCLLSIQESGHSTVIAGPDVDECVYKLSLLLEHDIGVRELIIAWQIISMLTEHTINSSASAYNLLSAILADGALSSRIHCAAVKHLKLCCEDEAYHKVGERCLSYLCGFSSSDGPRQVALGQTPGLMKALVDASVSFKDHLITQGIFGTLMNLLGRCLSEMHDTHNAVEFFRVGGLSVQAACLEYLTNWLEPVLASGKKDSEEFNTLARVFYVLRAIYLAYPSVQSELPGLCNCDMVLALAEHVHQVLSRSRHPALVQPALICVIAAVGFMRCTHAELLRYTLEKFLLYPDSNGLDVSRTDVPVMVWMVRWRKSGIFSDDTGVWRFMWLQFFRDCSVSSRIEAVIACNMGRQYDLPTEISPNVRHCHFPLCMISSDTTQSGPSSLKMCKGCGCVSYCGREHQKADWKRHRKDCKKEGAK
ncbi:hypothetical protein B484DRAFT_447703 [Ochromonadaceae sp. CCMP2298]|nr:hypothetical protein B484DRAFT_447703 [Ochromonadaceae sp. CCMP2298]